MPNVFVCMISMSLGVRERRMFGVGKITRVLRARHRLLCAVSKFPREAAHASVQVLQPRNRSVVKTKVHHLFKSYVVKRFVRHRWGGNILSKVPEIEDVPIHEQR